MEKTEQERCPKCKSKNVAWILWGYPNMNLIQEELDKGEITLGGCIITDNDPKWECNDCSWRWGERDDD